MILVRVEYHAAENAAYGRACFVDCLERGEAPLSSAVYADLAEFDQHEQRFEAAHTWLSAAKRLVIYTDFGINARMSRAIRAARAVYLPIEFRSLPAFANPANPFAGQGEVP
jgi:hypothetical protein